MPYKLEGTCVKKGNEILKCYETRNEALAYFRALKINADEAKDTGQLPLQPAMIAFYLPDHTALSLYSYARTIAGTTNNVDLSGPPDYHLTLCYLGNITDDEFAGIAETMLNQFGCAISVSGIIGGVGRFFNDRPDDPTNAIYASFDSPELPAFRQSIVNILNKNGIAYPDEHGFTPHITLAYIDKYQPTPPIIFSPIDCTFDKLVLAHGDHHVVIPLGACSTVDTGEAYDYSAGSAYVCPDCGCDRYDYNMKAGRNYSARVGEQIAGNLCRGPGGGFAACNSPGAKPVGVKPMSERQISQQRARVRRIAVEGRRKIDRSSRDLNKKHKKLLADLERDRKRQARAAEQARKRAEREARRKKRKPAKTPEQREQEKLQKRDANRQDVRSSVAERFDAGAFDELMKFADGGDVAEEKRSMLVDAGLVEQDEEGQMRLTTAGRSFVSASNSGDVREAADTLSRAREKKNKPKRSTSRRRRERRNGSNDATNNSDGDRVAGDADSSDNEEEKSFTDKPTSLSVYKNRQGQWRWLLVSSTSFMDRDGEIVAIKALENDVRRADIDGDYGPLLWWHMPIKLGSCDFNAIHSKSLIESGTFVNDRIAEVMYNAAPLLQASILFGHKGLDKDNTYWFIRRKERSLTPRGRASNVLTHLLVTKEKNMEKEKIEALKSLGVDDALLSELLQTVEQREKAAETAGLASKEATTPDSVAATAPDNEPDAIKELAAAVTTVVADPVVVQVSEKAPVPAEAANVSEPDAEETEEAVYVGDFSPEEFTAMLVKAMQQAFTPLMESFASLQNGMKMSEKMTGMLDEMKGMLMSSAAKEVSNKAEEEERQRLHAEQITRLEHTVKEARLLQETHNKTIANLEDSLKELRGEQPTAFYRASNDPSTVIEDPEALKAFGLPGQDQHPLSWVDNFIMNGNGATHQ